MGSVDVYNFTFDSVSTHGKYLDRLSYYLLTTALVTRSGVSY